MKRLRHTRRLATLSGLACLGAMMFAAPCAAYTPPETNQRIVVTTSEGTILIAMAPENAPEHVKQFMSALAQGDFKGSSVVRVAPQFYVQIVGTPGTGRLAGLPVERLKVGNLRGALSVYDSGKPGDIPTLMLVLVKSPQLDPDYTSIGFVEAGLSLLKGISATPTVGDHEPVQAITITEMHVASSQERTRLRQAEVTPSNDDDGTALLAAVFIIACAAFVAALISAFRDRLGAQRVKSLSLLVALLTFFAVWVSLGGTTSGSGLVGVALFGGAIAMFRLMGRFEQPTQTRELGRSPQPRRLTDGELHSEAGIDQSQGVFEVVLAEGDASAGRLGSPGG
jgi:cyclophilin family peptidyl-prolyl cis-trans isomerase